jgi:hypothetical protein
MLDSCSSRMVNQTRILKLKSEMKDLPFVAFWQKQTSQAKSLACLGVGLVYTNSRVSLAEYLWLYFQMRSLRIWLLVLTWLCTLPPSWSVEWDASPANDDNAE